MTPRQGDLVKSTGYRIWFRISVAMAVVLAGGAAVAFRLVTPSVPQAPAKPAPADSPGVPWFVDVAAAGGIGFGHFDPATDQHLILETLGSGLAWIDYDNDGWPDLFCVQDGPIRPPTPTLPPGRERQ